MPHIERPGPDDKPKGGEVSQTTVQGKSPAARSFLGYDDALAIARHLMGLTADVAQRQVGWSDQSDAAASESATIVDRSRGILGVGGAASVEHAHGAAIWFQILTAASSAGLPRVTCKHTRSMDLLTGTDLPLMRSPRPVLLIADPFVCVCVPCMSLPQIRRSIFAQRSLYTDECDRCGQTGPMTPCMFNAGVGVGHYGACMDCVTATAALSV